MEIMETMPKIPAHCWHDDCFARVIEWDACVSFVSSSGVDVDECGRLVVSTRIGQDHRRSKRFVVSWFVGFDSPDYYRI
jgi:hypothetical protein